MGWFPGRIKTGLGGPFDAEEIDTPDRGGVEMLRQTLHGDGQFGGPFFGSLVDTYAALHAAFYVLKRAIGDFQVDPKTVGTYLEFFVAAQLSWIMLQENFSDIAVPKLVAAAVNVGIFKDRDESISREKFQVQKFGRPKDANFGLAMRISIFSLPVCVEEHGFCASPRVGRREPDGIERAMKRSGENCVAKCLGGRGEPFAHAGIFVS